MAETIVTLSGVRPAVVRGPRPALTVLFLLVGQAAIARPDLTGAAVVPVLTMATRGSGPGDGNGSVDGPSPDQRRDARRIALAVAMLALVGALVAFFGVVGTIAAVRAVRRARRGHERLPRSPATPSDDVWARHVLPTSEGEEASGE